MSVTRRNQRRYPREVRRRVAVIKVAQRLGVPLAEIAAALASLSLEHCRLRNPVDELSENGTGPRRWEP